jgi:tRNA (Thr-GGU) A37 N-methylase
VSRGQSGSPLGPKKAGEEVTCRIIKAGGDEIGGEHMGASYYCERCRGFELIQHPRGDGNLQSRGVFALRSPQRPNPIGVTVVEVVDVERNVVLVRGLDAEDGTPVLDLKPAIEHGA